LLMSNFEAHMPNAGINFFLIRVPPEVVDFDSGQGRRGVETGGVAALRRGFQQRENAGLGQKMPFLEEHSYMISGNPVALANAMANSGSEASSR
jgi:hypothetical protein